MLTLMLLFACHFHDFWFDFVQRWQQNEGRNNDRIERNEVRLGRHKDKGMSVSVLAGLLQHKQKYKNQLAS